MKKDLKYRRAETLIRYVIKGLSKNIEKSKKNNKYDYSTALDDAIINLVEAKSLMAAAKYLYDTNYVHRLNKEETNARN